MKDETEVQPIEESPDCFACAQTMDTEKFKQFESENYDLRSQLHEAELSVQVIADQLREAQAEVARLKGHTNA